MRLLGKLLILLLTFVVGFVSAFAALFGAGYYVYKNVSLDSIGVSTDEIFDREAAEVQISALTLEALIGEVAELAELGETITLDALVLRYGVIIPEELDANIPESARTMPIKKLMSMDGVTAILDEVYIGQLLQFEKGEALPGVDDEFYWYEGGSDDEVTGIYSLLVNYTLADVLNGGIDFNEIMETTTIAMVLDLTAKDGYSAYINADGTYVACELNDNVKIWYNQNGERVDNTISALADMTVNELTTSLDSLTLYTLLGFVQHEGGYYSYELDNIDGTDCLVLTEQTGITTELAHLTVEDFSNGNIDDEVKDIKISTVLGYTYDEEKDEYYDENGNAVTGVMAIVAGTTVGGLDSKVNEIMVGEVCGFIKVEVEEGKYEWYTAYSETDPSLNKKAEGLMVSIASLKVNELKNNDKLVSCIENATVADALGYKLTPDGYVDKNDNPVKGVMGVIAGTPLNAIQAKVDSSKTGELMGLTYNSATGKWSDDEGEVHVLMNKIANTDFKNISNITDELILSDIMSKEQLENGFISLVDPDTGLNNISSEVNRVFDQTTLWDFVSKDIIEIETNKEIFYDDPDVEGDLGELTLKLLLQKIAENKFVIIP